MSFWSTDCYIYWGYTTSKINVPFLNKKGPNAKEVIVNFLGRSPKKIVNYPRRVKYPVVRFLDQRDSSFHSE